MNYKFLIKMAGVTLVELMIAMAVSAILLVGVGTIYGNSKRTYNVDDEFAHLQENARIAMKFILEDIRMSGYTGCVWNDGDANKFNCLLTNPGYACDTTTPGLEGFDATGTQANVGTAKTLADADANGRLDSGVTTNWVNSTKANLPAQFPTSTPAEPILGSDILITRYGKGRGIQMTQPQNGAFIKIGDLGTDAAATTSGRVCHNPTGICEDDVLVISDCNKARVFSVSTLANATNDIQINHADTGTAGNTPAMWGGGTSGPDDFAVADAEVMQFRTYAYYVGNNVKGEPALYRHNGLTGVAPEELVEGIENLQILYGIDDGNDGTINRYTSANTIDFADINNPVVAVRISMLVRSKDTLPSRPSKQDTHTLATTPIQTQNDKRLRKIFTTTVKIRNKGI